MTDERHQQIKQIFLKASNLSGDERRKYVEEATANDVALRREVELLLAHHSGSTIIPVAVPRNPSSEPTSKSRSKSRSRLSRTKTAWSRAVNLWANHLSVSGQMALGAAVVMIVIFALASWSHRHIYRSSREYWIGGLTSMLAATDQHITAWLEAEKRLVESWFADPKFRKVVDELYSRPPTPVDAGDDQAGDASAEGEANGAKPPVSRGGALADAVVQRSRKDAIVLAWANDGRALMGRPSSDDSSTVAAAAEIVKQVQRKGAIILPPQRCEAFAGPDWCGAGRPIMGVAAPVHDADGNAIGALFVGGPAMIAQLTTRLNSIALPGSGEAFAFDKQGRMLTESKHLEQLIAAGILPPGSSSSVLMPIRDPGGDITQGYKSDLPYAAHYPTLAVQRAMGGIDGVDVDGFPDYRGVMVIGGWHWIPHLDMGVVLKLDLADAYNQLDYLRNFFYARVILMIAAFLLLLYSWRSAVALRRRVADTPRVGPYVLDVAIGEGGMGRVYRAHHALLKRPTAVKIIKPELVSDQTTAWFEREVTLASKLTHPNTIEIYDFGSTEEGQFYCAMELLRGLTLSQVLLIEGSLPMARAVHVLRQAAASLAEAHDLGLMHRDIKLHNLMLCFLGGEADFLKVLDFGLAKHAGPSDPANTASTFNIAGTPLYMAPERLRPPYAADARSDVYSLGVVAFKLLTGRDLFLAETDLEMFNHALHSAAPSPSSFLKQPLPPELEDLIRRCLAKDPNDRPASAGDLLDVLDLLAARHPWRHVEAHAWWMANRQRIRDLAPDWDARNFSGFLRSASKKPQPRSAT